MDKFNFEPSSVNEIKSNPEKPTDLETATSTNFQGLDIDFFNLGRPLLNRVVFRTGYVPLYLQILHGGY